MVNSSGHDAKVGAWRYQLHAKGVYPSKNDNSVLGHSKKSRNEYPQVNYNFEFHTNAWACASTKMRVREHSCPAREYPLVTLPVLETQRFQKDVDRGINFDLFNYCQQYRAPPAPL